MRDQLKYIDLMGATTSQINENTRHEAAGTQAGLEEDSASSTPISPAEDAKEMESEALAKRPRIAALEPLVWKTSEASGRGDLPVTVPKTIPAQQKAEAGDAGAGTKRKAAWDSWLQADRRSSTGAALHPEQELDIFKENLSNVALLATTELWYAPREEVETWAAKEDSLAVDIGAKVLTSLRHGNPFPTGLSCQGGLRLLTLGYP